MLEQRIVHTGVVAPELMLVMAKLNLYQPSPVSVAVLVVPASIDPDRVPVDRFNV